nr:helix-turn-helix transcriptional regulator [Paenibacillus sp. MMS18-CY102]
MKEKGASNRKLADSCRIPYSTVVSIEYGHSDVTQSQLETIADFLQVTPLQLLGLHVSEPAITIEARFRVQGYETDPEVNKALEFASNFLTHIEELKQLGG